MKRVFLYLLAVGCAFLFFLGPTQVRADKPVTLYFFWSKGCSHCAEEKVFLAQMQTKYPELIIRDFEISTNQENLNLLRTVAQKINVRGGGVPLTVVGENHVLGFLNEQITGRQIEEAIQCAIQNRCPDLVADLVASPPSQKKAALPETLHLPILGEIKTKNLSLPTLTIIIGLLDGFNPCAMWVLLFLISLLLGIKDRRRMWLLGIAFIIASALVYFLFLAAWLNLFLFLGLIIWVRIIIGLAALTAGGYSLRDYWLNKEGGCEVVADKKRQRIFEKIKTVTQKKNFWLALGGMVFLAFAVNLVELVCSAGLPAVYTQILSLNQLARWQYYGYLLLYILFFMADDLFVFFVAMTTLRAIGIEHKYARLSRLIGGSLMLLIGLLLIFKPEVLMFG